MNPPHVTPHGLEVGGLHRVLLSLTLGLLWATGLLWALLHYGPESLRLWEEAHPIKPLGMKIHGTAAWGFLLVFGALIPLHLRRGWMKRHGRLSGGLLTVGVSLVILTGWLLTYAGGEGIRQAAHWIHLLLGVLLPLGLWAHIRWERSR